MTRVVLVKTNDRAAGVRQALELLKPPSPSCRDILLKPNFNSSHPTPGSTHNDVLRALVAGLEEAGATSVTPDKESADFADIIGKVLLQG